MSDHGQDPPDTALEVERDVGVNEVNAAEVQKQLRREEERRQIEHAVETGKLDRRQERVAWLLNHFGETRDSDARLVVRYWETFDTDVYAGGPIDPDDLVHLTPYPSIVRARAKVQNTYGLYQASAQIRRFRGTLSEEERERAIEQRAPSPTLTVHADESKSGNVLIVGSVWFLHAPEILSVANRIEAWKAQRGIDWEFHFTKMSRDRLPLYKEFADFLSENSAVMSFKAISVDARGHRDKEAALLDLTYHLLVQGTKHENERGRAVLPRRMLLTLDQVEEGRDRLFLANLSDRLNQAAATTFDGNLDLGTASAASSAGNVFLQIADVFTGSLNRVLNRAPGQAPNHKDEFADYLLQVLRVPPELDGVEEVGDLSVHIKL